MSVDQEIHNAIAHAIAIYGDHDDAIFEAIACERARQKSRLIVVQSGNTLDSEVIAHFQTDQTVSLQQLTVHVPYTPGGVSSVTVKHMGVNFLLCDTFYNREANGITYTGTTVDGKIVSIACTGTSTKNNCFNNLNYADSALKLPPDGSYACYAYTDDVAIVFSSAPNFIYDRNGGKYDADVTGWRKYDLAAGRNNTAEYCRLQMMPYRCSGKSFDLVAYPLVCLASDEGCEYEPYRGQTYTVTLPSPIYGGSIDLVTGLVTGEYASDGTILTTPETQQISGQQINTLSGINNVWSDEGNIELAYLPH